MMLTDLPQPLIPSRTKFSKLKECARKMKEWTQKMNELTMTVE